MPSEDFGKRMGRIEGFLYEFEHHGKCRIVLACRSRHWSRNSKIEEFVMPLLEPERIPEFIARQIPEEAARDLNERLDATWRRICQNPQRLQVLINVCYDPDTGQVDRPPDTIAQLFEAFTEKLLNKTMEQATKSNGEPPFLVEDIVLVLSELGAAMTHDMGMSTLVRWDWALDRLSTPFADQILEFACESRILCKPHKEHQELRFTHQLFQEFFAARELKQLMSRREFLLLLREPWWEETILLLADIIANPDDLVEKILQAQSPPNSYTLRLASECIARRKQNCSLEIIENIRNRLAELLDRGSGLAASAIRALSHLDDDESVDVIVPCLYRHGDWTREVAIEALIAMECPSAQKAIDTYVQRQGLFPSIIEAFRIAKRQGLRDSYILPATQLARLFLAGLFMLVFLGGCGAIIYLAKFFGEATVSGTPTPTPTPNPSLLTTGNAEWGYWSACCPGLGILVALIALAVAINPRDFFKRLLASSAEFASAEFALPLDKYVDPLRNAVVPGLLAGFGVLVVWGVRAGEFPFSKVQVFLIPLFVALYSFYLSWAWAIIRWSSDERKAGRSPLDQLAFSTSGGVFVAHLAIVLVLVAIGIAISLFRSVAPLASVVWAVIAPGGLSLVHRLGLLSEMILVIVLIVLPGFVGVLGVGSYFRYLKEKRFLNSLQQKWYNLSSKEKGECLKEQVLPIAFGEHKKRTLRERAVQVLSELRIEDVQDPESKEGMLRDILVQLANLYRLYGNRVIDESIQKMYVAVRDRYLKRPIKEREAAIISLLSIVLGEVYPHEEFETMEEARSVAYAENPELRHGY